MYPDWIDSPVTPLASQEGDVWRLSLEARHPVFDSDCGEPDSVFQWPSLATRLAAVCSVDPQKERAIVGAQTSCCTTVPTCIWIKNTGIPARWSFGVHQSQPSALLGWH